MASVFVLCRSTLTKRCSHRVDGCHGVAPRGQGGEQVLSVVVASITTSTLLAGRERDLVERPKGSRIGDQHNEPQAFRAQRRAGPPSPRRPPGAAVTNRPRRLPFSGRHAVVPQPGDHLALEHVLGEDCVLSLAKPRKHPQRMGVGACGFRHGSEPLSKEGHGSRGGCPEHSPLGGLESLGEPIKEDPAELSVECLVLGDPAPDGLRERMVGAGGVLAQHALRAAARALGRRPGNGSRWP